MDFATEPVLITPDFTLHRGEIVALTGPFALESLVRLCPQPGDARVGAVFGPWRGSGEWRVRDLIAQVCQAYQPDELLSLAGLSEQASCRIRVLGPGERRRLDVAVAIGAAPEVLLLASPTAGLVDADRRDVHELLDRLAELELMAILFTTPDPAEAYAVADRVVSPAERHGAAGDRDAGVVRGDVDEEFAGAAHVLALQDPYAAGLGYAARRA